MNAYEQYRTTWQRDGQRGEPGSPVLMVDSGDVDSDDAGNAWRVFYVLRLAYDGGDAGPYVLHREDDAGNGEAIGVFFRMRDARGVVLQLGEFMGWRAEIAGEFSHVDDAGTDADAVADAPWFDIGPDA